MTQLFIAMLNRTLTIKEESLIRDTLIDILLPEYRIKRASNEALLSQMTCLSLAHFSNMMIQVPLTMDSEV